MNNTLLQQITRKDAKAFTHSGKFHADDVFSSALLLYLNPEITITRGSKVPEGYDGSYLISDAESMTIIRKTAGSVKTECRMRHLDCSGSSSVPES